ncbi:hypothetical protein PSACC_01309 [Paramicrosporidium saccamoebae]|uniref:Uncharacterized protein n=1 Tax=Paramicrosporidium saccamoebae TaxID=1246581 RepID=A0A2H9TMC5_9FUNG|nr:hypothetical protein PSACC_01309 [Paramicrosporidium saccamoebae]
MGTDLDDLFGIPEDISKVQFIHEDPTSTSDSSSPRLNSDTPATLANLETVMQRIVAIEEVLRQVICVVQQTPVRPAEIRKGQLDRHCITLFEKHPEPTITQLAGLIRSLEDIFPGHDRRELLSLVRRWFRKKREEVGLKVVAALKRMYGDLKSKRDEIEKALQDETFDFGTLIEETRLCLESTPAVIGFCREKINCQLRRLQS